MYDSANGRAFLIPQGARLIGDYKASAKYGQSRAAIKSARLIMPDGREINLDLPAQKPSSAARVTGKVANHWISDFRTAQARYDPPPFRRAATPKYVRAISAVLEDRANARAPITAVNCDSFTSNPAPQCDNFENANTRLAASLLMCYRVNRPQKGP